MPRLIQIFSATAMSVGLFSHFLFSSEESSYYFQTIAGNQAIKNSLWYLSEGTKKTISASRVIRSPDYKYDPQPVLYFYGDRIDEEGKPIVEAVVMVPNDASRLLLLFNKLPKHNEQGHTYKVVAIKDDYEGFEFGSFKFINASNKELAINISGEQLLINQSVTKVVKVDPPEKGDVSIQIFARDDKGAWKSNYANGWGHREDLRTLVFILNGTNGRIKALRYRQTQSRE